MLFIICIGVCVAYLKNGNQFDEAKMRTYVR